MTTIRKRAIIISPRIIASHQIVCLLDAAGWRSRCTHTPVDIRRMIEGYWPSALVVLDITAAFPQGMRMLHQLASAHWPTRCFALCEGGNTPMMRKAKRLGVDGFFYLNRHGLALDPTRGAAAYFRFRQTSHPPQRQDTQHSSRPFRPALGWV
ncbi:MAG: hypothetical protein D6678_06760 [Zetaproteobacteria bacterium]|nr:MAG: hypothetical protein D6678_06760 [Zetaproteobacteria bacterium]